MAVPDEWLPGRQKRLTEPGLQADWQFSDHETGLARPPKRSICRRFGGAGVPQGAKTRLVGCPNACRFRKKRLDFGSHAINALSVICERDRG